MSAETLTATPGAADASTKSADVKDSGAQQPPAVEEAAATGEDATGKAPAMKIDNKLPDMPDVKAAPFTSKAKASFADVTSFTVGASNMGAGGLNKSQWTTVLSNCGVFYGWLVDVESSRIVQAPKPAFRLRSKRDPVPESKALDAGPSTALVPAPAPTTSGPDPNANAAIVDTGSTKDTTDSGIPNFRVNDGSHIEITACEHEFEISMARNDFSTNATELSIGGTVKGVSASISAGFSNSKSKTNTALSNTYKKTLVARYLYPRCDIFLNADDLEPSPELAQAIDLVKRTKSIKHLRKLHADFGNLFCQNLTLGARLTSTKIITSDVTKSEQEQKEQFKVSFGLAVSTPKEAKFAGEVALKTEHTKGFTESVNTTNNTATESNVFEAASGDTILANNPVAWAPTVSSPELWRVINRDDLSALFDVVVQFPGYEKVRSYFVQAIPALSRYVTLDEGHREVVRLKLVAPLNNLSLDGQTFPAYYLGHKRDVMCTPRLMGVSGQVEDFWTAVEYTQELPLFSPKTFRGPAIIGYANNMVGDSMFGAKYNPDFAQTTWSITAPFSEKLTHGCRVVLGTQPYVDSTLIPKPGEVSVPPPPVSFMVVFRNQQGVFLPGMSESDEVQYWRVMKKDSTRVGEHIKEGDELRFCWSFSDQTTGYRDYTNDVFGRRSIQPPPEAPGDLLYMKIPWPRFETGGTPNSMIMTPSPSTDLEAFNIPVLPAKGKDFTYVMQDVVFRINSVPNGGRGDSNDYLMRSVAQLGDKMTYYGYQKDGSASMSFVHEAFYF